MTWQGVRRKQLPSNWQESDGVAWRAVVSEGKRLSSGQPVYHLEIPRVFSRDDAERLIGLVQRCVTDENGKPL